jgi:hypothetical protein
MAEQVPEGIAAAEMRELVEEDRPVLEGQFTPSEGEKMQGRMIPARNGLFTEGLWKMGGEGTPSLLATSAQISRNDSFAATAERRMRTM